MARRMAGIKNFQFGPSHRLAVARIVGRISASRSAPAAMIASIGPVTNRLGAGCDCQPAASLSLVSRSWRVRALLTSPILMGLGLGLGLGALPLHCRCIAVAMRLHFTIFDFP